MTTDRVIPEARRDMILGWDERRLAREIANARSALRFQLPYRHTRMGRVQVEANIAFLRDVASLRG